MIRTASYYSKYLLDSGIYQTETKISVVITILG